MSNYPSKINSSNIQERPDHSSLVEETNIESGKSRQTPRFSRSAFGRRQTAKKHSFSVPDRMGMGYENSDGPDRFIPGAFPDDSVENAKHMNDSSHSGRHGVRVGTGLMLQDDEEVDRSQLPTSEQPSLSRVGVGSLPGTIKESGVAILPEERIHPDPYLRGYTVLDASNLSKGGANQSAKSVYELPTTEVPSGSRIGIGSMPGTIHEGGVATLPEERIDGRPYGSGHTGFEDTLGKGNTIRQAHPHDDAKSAPISDVDSKSATVSNPQSAPKTSAQIVVDDQARKALHEQNPVRAPIEKRNTFPTTSHSTQAEQTLPGDTIFSATQRARDHDPNFVARLGGQTETTSKPVTTTSGDQIKLPQNLAAQGEQHLGSAGQVGASVIESVEGAAIGAIHGAEHVFRNIESNARAYFPDVSKQGAEDMLHNLESSAKAHIPNVSAYFGLGGSNSDQDTPKNRRSPAPGAAGQSAKMSGTFVTSGADAPHSKAKDFATFNYQKSHPTKEIVPESAEDSRFSDRIARRLKGVEAEYYEKGEYDMYGESLDTHQFIYDDDFTTEEEDSVISQNSNQRRYKGDAERDLASDRARGSYAPGDRSARAKSDSADVLYGHEGVGYYRRGKDGNLPGYPTPEGMNKLISDRMKDDHLLATGAANAPKEKLNEKLQTGGTVQGPIADGVSVDTDDYGSEISLVQRDPEEVKEAPIFKSGMPTASGKFEAVFEPSSEYLQERSPKTSAAASNLEKHGSSDPDTKSKNYRAQDISTTGAIKVGYLGKPVSEEEKSIEIERARQAAARKLGIN